MSQVRRSRRRVTLADIADACGVSRATVSLVLSGSSLVGARTRVRVEAELEEQGYVYNRSAANLRRQTSSTVALLINDLSNPFFAEFAAGVDEALAAAGYAMLLGGTGESVVRQAQVLSSLMEHTPAGVILSPAEGTDGKRLRQLVGTHTPVLVFNRAIPGSTWDFLVCDNRRGAYLAATHLLTLGHRRIAFFGGHADSSSCCERRHGFTDALTEAGIAIRDDWLVECAPGRLAAAAGAEALFRDGERPTAAVCYNDVVALGLMHALAAHGFEVGTDFSVTGFDDIPESAVISPALTTVAVGPRALGRRAGELILERGDHTEALPRRIVAPVELVTRASTGSPPQAPP